jgi:ubiquinone/menaquinone biosynthesis C-methylase UbiE
MLNQAPHFQNEQVYEDQNVVSEYLHAKYLIPPEQTIINDLADQLPGMSMLDIAVGGGRTTYHFAGRVKNYVGTDYSAKMIEACEERFKGHADNISFKVADMRHLDIFPEHAFDFILISFNAISVLSHEDRLATLKQIRRIGKPGGYFCFSAHNLQWTYNVFSLTGQISWLHPKHTYWNLLKWYALRRHNVGSTIRNRKNMAHAIVNDGAHDFRLEHYYLTPAEQLLQLRDDFTHIRVFARDGHEISNPDEIKNNRDGYLYYLCTIS